MAVLKTTQTDADVNEFINTFAQTDQRRNDSLELIRIMTSVSGYPPKMWGASIVGLGVIIINLNEVGKKEIGCSLDFLLERRLFHFMCIQVVKVKKICLQIWENTPWVKPVFILKN